MGTRAIQDIAEFLGTRALGIQVIVEKILQDTAELVDTQDTVEFREFQDTVEVGIPVIQEVVIQDTAE